MKVQTVLAKTVPFPQRYALMALIFSKTYFQTRWSFPLCSDDLRDRRQPNDERWNYQTRRCHQNAALKHQKSIYSMPWLLILVLRFYKFENLKNLKIQTWILKSKNGRHARKIAVAKAKSRSDSTIVGWIDAGNNECLWQHNWCTILQGRNCQTQKQATALPRSWSQKSKWAQSKFMIFSSMISAARFP